MTSTSTPPLLRLLRETRALAELPRLAWRLPDLAAQPRGAGEAVLVLPGFGTNDQSTFPLRGYLRLLGYQPRGWGMGFNRGDVPDLIPKVSEATARAAEEAGHPVRLVGWSLGGYLAREAAREQPDSVSQVITLGTPVVGGPKYTAVAGYYRSQGIDLDEIEAEVEARYQVPIRAPITAIYSRTDAVVEWQACIDRFSPDVEHVEVSSSHVGLGIAPDVYRIVAQRLAQPRPAEPADEPGPAERS